METFSGSMVEPAVPYLPPDYQNQQKQKKFFAIIAIAEAVIILGLAIGLVAIAFSGSNNSGADIADDEQAVEQLEDYDFRDFEITDEESTTLRYIYALANNPSLNVGQAPSFVCETITKLYNRFAADNTVSGELCENNQLILSTEYADSEYYPNPVLYKFSIVRGGKTYNLYVDLDLRSFSYVDSSDELPNDTTTIMIGEQ